MHQFIFHWYYDQTGTCAEDPQGYSEQVVPCSEYADKMGNSVESYLLKPCHARENKTLQFVCHFDRMQAGTC